MSHLLDTISFGAIVAVRDRLLEQQAAGRTIYRLESGDPSFDVPKHVKDAIHAALDKNLTHYTASTGVLPLREAIVKKVRRDNHLPIDNAEQVVVTNGGMHALYLTFRALLEPGDEVILPDPMWTEIAENIKLGGGTPVRVTLEREHGMAYTAAAIERHITPKTRAIFLNTPHNPTGVVLSEPELRAIGDLALKHKLWVISDEAYEHVIFDGAKHVSIGSLPGMEERTLTLFSASKSYAMSGLRIGYIAGRDKVMLERIKKLLRCTINGVNSITQYGAAAALAGPQDAPQAMGAEYQARRDALLNGIAGVKALKPFKPGGSFFLWLSIDPSWEGYNGARDDWAMTNFLIDKGGVGCAPGTAFGPSGAGCVRLAFSCDRPQVEAAARIVRGLLA
ncbi:MAG: pyridoxal phosphate-dependent aminotransferase [Myxococcaceae bacterium]